MGDHASPQRIFGVPSCSSSTSPLAQAMRKALSHLMIILSISIIHLCVLINPNISYKSLPGGQATKDVPAAEQETIRSVSSESPHFSKVPSVQILVWVCFPGPQAGFCPVPTQSPWFSHEPNVLGTVENDFVYTTTTCNIFCIDIILGISLLIYC